MYDKRLFGLLSMFLLPLSAMAGHQVCGSREVAANVRTCPDGSIPRYVADEIKPYVPTQAASESSRPTKRNEASVSD